MRNVDDACVGCQFNASGTFVQAPMRVGDGPTLSKLADWNDGGGNIIIVLNVQTKHQLR